MQNRNRNKHRRNKVCIARL